MENAIALKGNIVPAELFKPFQVQIDEFKDINDKTVFDYDKQNKEARSHVAKLRKAKKPINDVHREAKSEALKLGKDLDAYKKNLISQIDEMIEVHVEPLQRIEDAEKERLEALALLEEKEKDHAEAIEMHDLFKREEDMKKQKAELKEAQDKLDAQAKKQKLEKEQLERDAKIKKDAEEKAEKETELKLEKERNKSLDDKRDARIKRIIALGLVYDGESFIKDDINIHHTEVISNDEMFESIMVKVSNTINDRKAEKEKQDALDKQAEKQKEKERIEKKRVADEKKETDRLQAIEDKKAANKAHRKSVNNKIVKCLMEHKVSEKDAQDIIVDIVKEKIPGLSIKY